MYSEFFNNLPTWLRGLLFIGLIIGLNGFWVYEKTWPLFQKHQGHTHSLESLHKHLGMLKKGVNAPALEIYQSQVTKKENLSDTLEDILHNMPKKSLTGLSTKPLLELKKYLTTVPEEKKKHRRSRRKKNEKDIKPAIKRQAVLEEVLRLKKKSTAPLLAQEMEVKILDNFKNIHSILKKIHDQKDLFWREIIMDVQTPPQTQATLKVFAIAKE